MSVARMFPNIVCDELSRERDFYVDLFGLKVRFQSDWFVHLSTEDGRLELGFLRRDHAVVPNAVRGEVDGVMLTLVVEDVDQLHEKARAAGVPIEQAPTDLFYGQRRMIIRDPAGTRIDVSSECAPDPNWLARVESGEAGAFVEV